MFIIKLKQRIHFLCLLTRHYDQSEHRSIYYDGFFVIYLYRKPEKLSLTTILYWNKNSKKQNKPNKDASTYLSSIKQTHTFLKIVLKCDILMLKIEKGVTYEEHVSGDNTQ